MITELVEPVFGVNKFRKPKVLHTAEATIQSILMVIFMKPGTYPSIPELGLDIRKYRVFRADQVDLDDIRAALVYQCSILREGMVNSNVSVDMAYQGDGSPILLIQIPIQAEKDSYNLIVGIWEIDGQTSYNYQLVETMLNSK